MQTFSILLYSFCYSMVFILAWISKKETNYRLIKDNGGITDKPGQVMGFHIAGILWLGLVPVLLLKKDLAKVLTGNGVPDGKLLFFFLLLLALTAALAVKGSKNMPQHVFNSETNNNRLSDSYIIRYFIIRMTFLFVYEMFFRGFLLFDSIHAMGIPLAVSLNVFLYVLLHLFNSKKEMLTCIPFGLLVCWLSILFNAVWPAVILHITFSLLFEINIYQSHYSASKIVHT